ALMVLAIYALIFANLSACRQKQPVRVTTAPPPPAVKSIADQWKDAALKVEEDRNEPAGSHATVRVPAAPIHSGNLLQFLSIQEAEWRKKSLEMPRDLLDMVPMIEQGLLVEMDPVGDDYVLFGVGCIVTDGPVSHYAPVSRQSIPIFASDQEFAGE